MIFWIGVYRIGTGNILAISVEIHILGINQIYFNVSLTWYDDYTVIIIINHHQNVFFIIVHKTIHAQSQWPSTRHLEYYNLYYDWNVDLCRLV